jgi:multisubunit Na+/H+ antiporter MnhF subunit
MFHLFIYAIFILCAMHGIQTRSIQNDTLENRIVALEKLVENCIVFVLQCLPNGAQIKHSLHLKPFYILLTFPIASSSGIHQNIIY